MTISRFTIESISAPLARGNLILVPNHRMRDAILYSYGHSKQQSGAWTSPRVLAIDIWLQNTWQNLSDRGIDPFNQFHLLGKQEEYFIWLEILESSVNNIPLLNPGETALAVSRAYQLAKQWYMDEIALSSFSGISDVAAFLQWSDQFTGYCRRHQLIGLSDATEKIVIELDENDSELEGEIYLLGFSNPPPLYQSLFDKFPEKTVLVNTTHPDPHTNRYTFADLQSEVTACANWARNITDEYRAAHIGIISENLTTRFDLIYPLFCDTYQPAASNSLNEQAVINSFTAARNLDRQQTIDLIFRVLGLNHYKQETAEFCYLLQNPRISGFKEEEQARVSLQLRLRQRCEARSRIADLKNHMLTEDSDHHCPVLAEKLQQFEHLRRQRATRGNATHWADLFEQQLTLIDWNEPQCHMSEKSLFSQWQEVLAQFRGAAHISGEMDCYAAIFRLKLLCRQTPTKNPFTPSLNVSLLSVDQAMGFHFTHIWILGMDDRSWPAPVRHIPFLPYALQKELELPGSSSQLQLEQAQHDLTFLIQASRESVVFSHHEIEEDEKLRVSSLIRETEAKQFTLPDPPAELTECSIELVKDPQLLPLGKNETIRGGASLLTNQANCPFRAFAIHRLKSEALPEFRSGFDPLARGSALHLALEQFWKTLKSSDKLEQLTSEALAEHIDSSVVVALRWLKRKFPETMTLTFSELESNRLTVLLNSFLAIDKERSRFETIATEQSLEWKWGPLTLKLKVDRVDRLGDGSLVLIDYKTGRKTDYKWFDDRPEDLQLPLYQLTLSEQSDKELSAALICQVTVENIAYFGATDLVDFHPALKPLAKNRAFDGSWPELQQRWNTMISSIASEFEQGLLTVSPTRGRETCRYCELAGLCRIDEQAALNDLVEEEAV